VEETRKVRKVRRSWRMKNWRVGTVEDEICWCWPDMLLK
jgi:hypothetical protein